VAQLLCWCRSSISSLFSPSASPFFSSLLSARFFPSVFSLFFFRFFPSLLSVSSSLFSWCCCCWARGDDEGVGSVGAAPGVAAAAGMEEKMRSVWGSVDREGCFGCREEMAERGEWPGGGLFLGALSLSPPFNKTLLVLNFFLSPFQKVFPPSPLSPAFFFFTPTSSPSVSLYL